MRNAPAGFGIVGMATIDLDDDVVGRLDDLVIEPRSGHIIYAVLSFNGSPGFADKLLAVPWQALRIDAVRRCLVLRMPRELLQGAPCFDRDRWPNMADRTFHEAVFAHYGCPMPSPRT